MGNNESALQKDWYRRSNAGIGRSAKSRAPDYRYKASVGGASAPVGLVACGGEDCFEIFSRGERGAPKREGALCHACKRKR